METTEFQFPKKKVRIKPVTRKGGWLPPNHDGQFMFTNTAVSYQVPLDSHNNLALKASEEELRAIEKAMSVPTGYLSPNKPKKENFWLDFNNSIRLTKDGIELNLHSPQDYIKYIIARSNVELIAPNWDERLKKGTYKFAIVDEESENKAKATEVDITAKVWTAFGQISTSDVKMSNVLRLLLMGTNVKVPKSAKTDFLKTEIEKFVKNEPRKFLSVVEDPDYTLKSEILQAVDLKVISKDGLKYFVTGYPDAKMTFEALTEYLKNPENQDILLEIKERIK